MFHPCFAITARLGNQGQSTLKDNLAAAAPFVVMLFIVMLLVIAFPQLATALL